MLKIRAARHAAALALARRALAGLKAVASEYSHFMGVPLRRHLSEVSTYLRPLERGALPSLGPSVPELRLVRNTA